MRTIIDSRRQLNYNPLVVYIILSGADHIRFDSTVDKMNKYNGFTFDLFKFKIIERGDNHFSGLSNEISDSLKESNAIVRLIDDNKGNFNYAVGRIDFCQNLESFEKAVKAFMLSVIEKNIDNLVAVRRNVSNDVDDENARLLADIIDRFVIAKMSHKFIYISWRYFCFPPTRHSESDREYVGTGGFLSWTPTPKEFETSKKIISNNLTDPDAIIRFEQLMECLESVMEAPDEEESNSLAQATVDDTKSRPLVLEQKSRVEPDIKPDITIKVVSVKGKYFGYGFEFKIDNNPSVLLYLNSKEALFVYLLTLLKKKTNECLYLSVFKDKVPDSPLIKRSNNVIWMKNLYDKVFPNETDGFDTWYKKAREKSCHAITNGKGNANRAIRKILADYEDALWYCCIQDENSDPRYYFIDIPADNITLPEFLME